MSLRAKESYAASVEPSDRLRGALAACGRLEPRDVTVVKTRPRRGSSRACEVCGGVAGSAWLDLGIGEHAGVVVESVRGHWCWDCLEAVVDDPAGAVVTRLDLERAAASDDLLPSFAYDTPAHPRSVQFEITTECNLTCAYCTNRLLSERRHLPVDRFHALLDRIDLAAVDNVDFTGLGEPLLNPALPDMIRAVLERGRPSQVRVVTNGTALTRRIFEPLCDAGITSIAISVDSLDPERFSRSRGGAKLARVLSNIEALCAFRAERGLDGLDVKIKAVLVDGAWKDAEDLLVYSARTGISMPHFSSLDSRVAAVGTYDQPWLADSTGAREGSELLARAEARWRELGRPLPHARVVERPTPAERAAGFHHPGLLPPGPICRWAVDATFFTLAGESLSCCETMIDLPRPILAGTDGRDLRSLWADDLLWAYRLPLSLGLVPRNCLGCPQAPPGGRSLDA